MPDLCGTHGSSLFPCRKKALNSQEHLRFRFKKLHLHKKEIACLKVSLICKASIILLTNEVAPRGKSEKVAVCKARKTHKAANKEGFNHPTQPMMITQRLFFPEKNSELKIGTLSCFLSQACFSLFANADFFFLSLCAFPKFYFWLKRKTEMATAVPVEWPQTVFHFFSTKF